jgi:hypothetical protein
VVVCGPASSYHDPYGMGFQMARSYDYAVVKIAPDPIRDEALNVALVILRPEPLGGAPHA